MDVGSWFNRRYPDLARAEFSSEGVPTLEQTLHFLEGFNGLIYVELKCKTDEDACRLVEAVAGIISASPLLPQLIVQSFNLSTLRRMRQSITAVKTSALFAPKVKRLLKRKEALVELAGKAGADCVSLHHLLVNSRAVRRASSEGMPITVWTVDRRRWLQRARRIGVFALITNTPASLIAARSDMKR